MNANNQAELCKQITDMIVKGVGAESKKLAIITISTIIVNTIQFKVPAGARPWCRRSTESAGRPRKDHQMASPPIRCIACDWTGHAQREREEHEAICPSVKLFDMFAAAALTGLCSHGFGDPTTWAPIAYNAARAMMVNRAIVRRRSPS